MLGGAPRLARVVSLAAEKAGWGTPLPPNSGRGIACVSAQEKKTPTWTASVVQARVDPASGKVQVEKIVCAVDCGIVVNPDGARSQIEGSLLFGISNALKERGTVANGTLVQSNFHDYQVLRMNEVPEIEVHIVPSTEYPTGLGEPGTTTIAPALSNAIFAATGARVRQGPLLPDRLVPPVRAKSRARGRPPAPPGGRVSRRHASAVRRTRTSAMVGWRDMAGDNVVIVGFMGAGKSVCGRLLARRLGRCFVETDDMIVSRDGRSIPDIFRQSGEDAF